MDNLYEMIQKADSGDAEAQWRVAYYIVCENMNEDIEADWLERAINYFKLAAAQDYTDAMLDLAAMYNIGRGVAHDMDLAIYWWKRAAACLCPNAFCPLGVYDGREEDGTYTQVSFGYFLKGALLDDPECIGELGVMYFNGAYVDQDQIFAFDLYKRSYDYMIHDTCREGFSEAYMRYEGFGEICMRLGMCYNDGSGTKYDINMAKNYFLIAIKAYEYRMEKGYPKEFYMGGYNRAKFLLKRITADRTLVENNVVETEIITPESLYKFGVDFFENKQDYEKAFKYFAKCILHKTNVSCNAFPFLARMYRESIYVDIDEKFAEFLERQT